MREILTPWHRECIERGATLLVIPFDKQPRWGEPPQRSNDDPGIWYARGVDELGYVVREYAYCPFYPGTVIRVGDIRLRVTDVACVHLDDGLDVDTIDRTRMCDGWENILRRIVSGIPSAVFDGCVMHNHEMLDGIRQSHPSFPSDGYVWLVSITKEG